MTEGTVSITVDEYAELLTARTRLNIISAWSESDDPLSKIDVQHICLTYKKEGDSNDII